MDVLMITKSSLSLGGKLDIFIRDWVGMEIKLYGNGLENSLWMFLGMDN